MEKSLGERRVRTDFNVSGESAIDEIKTKTAELINIVNACPVDRHEDFCQAKVKD